MAGTIARRTTDLSPRQGNVGGQPTIRLDPEPAFVAAVALTAFAAAVLWGLLIPFNAAPDEYMHFPINRSIAANGRLPLFDQSPDIPHTRCSGEGGPCVTSYAHAPPGRALLGAALLRVHHALTGSPYEELRRTPRLASALCVAAYVAFLALAARALLPDRFVRLTAVAIGAFIPQVTFLGAYTNDDTLGLAAGAATVWAGLVILRDGLDRRLAVVAGAILGLFVLSKTNYWTLAVPCALCTLLRLRGEWWGGSPRRFLGRLALTGGVAALVGGW